jgi:hypothetical protein
VNETLRLNVQGLDFVDVRTELIDSEGYRKVSFWISETEFDHRFVGSDPVRSPSDPAIHSGLR